MSENDAPAKPLLELLSACRDLFMSPLSDERGTCIACHTIGGTDATGVAGPNLTRFADPTHECFAGCDWETYVDGQPNLEALKAWLRPSLS